MAAGRRDRVRPDASMPQTNDITKCLLDWQADPKKPETANRLASLTYQHLRRLAEIRLRDESRQCLSPTELVHETWLAIRPPGNALANRQQFFRLASAVMRSLLVDQARERQAQKRGGDRVRVTLSLIHAQHDYDDVRLLDLDSALSSLAEQHPRHAGLIELRCFGGFTMPEIADCMNLSLSTIKRDWNFARAWLIDAMATAGAGHD